MINFSSNFFSRHSQMRFSADRNTKLGLAQGARIKLAGHKSKGAIINSIQQYNTKHNNFLS